jgi:hypothetical protein
MTILYRLLAVLVIAAVSFAGGYFTRKPATRIETKVETREVEKIVRQVVTERTTKSDGTVVEKITENTKSNSETKSKSKDKIEIPLPRAEWSIGAQWGIRAGSLDYLPHSVEVGRRVIGPVWGTAGYQFQNNMAFIGLRVEF